jgi:hypothetical protein
MKQNKLKTIIELIKEQISRLEISDARALSFVEQTIGRSVDWTESSSIDRAFFDFIEMRQSVVLQ